MLADLANLVTRKRAQLLQVEEAPSWVEYWGLNMRIMSRSLTIQTCLGGFTGILNDSP